MRVPCVYILASERNGTLYIGVTGNLPRRIWQHRTGEVEGFSTGYGVKRLVYFETHENMRNAILRETQMKRWKRAWKIALIEEHNPDWLDLYPGIIARVGTGNHGFPLSRE